MSEATWLKTAGRRRPTDRSTQRNARGRGVGRGVGPFFRRLAKSAGVSAGVTLGVAGCAESPQPPDLLALYRETAVADQTGRNPLVVAPGTLGSRLRDVGSDMVFWGGPNLTVDPDDDDGFRLLSLPIGDGDMLLRDLRDDAVADGLLQRARVRVGVFGVIEEGVYDGIVGVLRIGGFETDRSDRREGGEEEGGEVEDGAAMAVREGDAAAAALAIAPGDSFAFAYDWRRDLVETARALYEELSRRRAEQIRRGEAPQRFDIVAHSMGGLAIRYFLLYGDAPLSLDGPLPEPTWAGAALIDKVVIVGAPHGGSPIAFENLVNGKSLSPLTPNFPAALVATHPSTYQLMPRARHRRVRWRDAPERPLDPFDPRLWDRYGWGLLAQDAAGRRARALLAPDLPDDEARRALALAHTQRLLKRAERFHQAIDVAIEPPPTLDPFLVVGGGFSTPDLAEVDPETGATEITGFAEGDGVVTRASALMDERIGAADGARGATLISPLRFRTTLFLPDEHVALTGNDVFGDNLLFWLLEDPRGAPSETLSRPRLSGDATPRERPATPTGVVEGGER